MYIYTRIRFYPGRLRESYRRLSRLDRVVCTECEKKNANSEQSFPRRCYYYFFSFFIRTAAAAVWAAMTGERRARFRTRPRDRRQRVSSSSIYHSNYNNKNNTLLSYDNNNTLLPCRSTRFMMVGAEWAYARFFNEYDLRSRARRKKKKIKIKQ